MQLRTHIFGLAPWFAVFVTCCLAMLWFGSKMNSEARVYPFMAIWGVSALLWPFFAVKVLRASGSGGVASMRRARLRRRGGYF